MTGKYRFIQDGKLIGEVENLLTTEGKFAILRYLAEQSQSIAGSIIAGVSTTAAAATDTLVGFEAERADIIVVSPDYVNQAIVYKAVFPTFERIDIREVGLWTAKDTAGTNRTVLKFEQDLEAWTVGTWDTTTARLGDNGLSLVALANNTATSVLDNLSMDISTMNANDTFALAYNVGSAFTSAVKVRLMTDDTNYFEFNIATPTAGYKVTRFTKSQLTKTGTPTTINKISVLNTATSGGTSTVIFDGLRTDSGDFSNPDALLLSHAVLGTPIVKPAGVPFEIEYVLDVTL